MKRKGAKVTRAIFGHLPDGREIAVTRTATADERFLDLDFTIDDAFKRAQATEYSDWA